AAGNRRQVGRRGGWKRRLAGREVGWIDGDVRIRGEEGRRGHRELGRSESEGYPIGRAGDRRCPQRGDASSDAARLEVFDKVVHVGIGRQVEQGSGSNGQGFVHQQLQ